MYHNSWVFWVCIVLCAVMYAQYHDVQYTSELLKLAALLVPINPVRYLKPCQGKKCWVHRALRPLGTENLNQPVWSSPFSWYKVPLVLQAQHLGTLLPICSNWGWNCTQWTLKISPPQTCKLGFGKLVCQVHSGALEAGLMKFSPFPVELYLNEI